MPAKQPAPPYRDEDIASILMDARTQVAGLPGGSSRCPIYTTMVDRAALLQQREWKSCTLNEFRKLYGLRRMIPFQRLPNHLLMSHTALPTFKAWNPNPDIWREAEKIYGNIDNLSLYVSALFHALVS